MQFHPEVAHTAHGQAMLERFLYDIAGIAPTWTPDNIIDDQVAAIRAAGRRHAGDLRPVRRRRLGGRRGARAPAVGDQLTCVFVDHGLLRAGEAEQVEKDYVAATGIKLKVVDAADRFLAALAGVTDPEQKRKIIGREFIRVFEEAAREVAARAATSSSWCRARSTRTWWSPAAAPAPPTSRRTTTSAACPTTCSSRWSSRCARCSRTRCARSAPRWACPRRWSGGTRSRARAWPSGSSARSTRDRLEVLRAADLIAREELTAAGLDRDVWQFPVVLLADVRSVGVQGDGRTYGHPVVLRPVSSEDAMTADWSRLPLRRDRADLHPHHQRGARGQPGRPRRDQQAAGHHRVGVTTRSIRP